MSRAGNIAAALRRLPMADLDTITQGGTAMILAPHPDDESLGCGGLIAESCARGRPPVVMILTDGTGSHPSSRSYPPSRLRALREDEARRAVAILGLPLDRLCFLGLRDTAAPQSGVEFDAAVTAVACVCQSNACQVICAPWLYDPHCDHEAAQIIARAAAERTGTTVLSYPVWGWLLADETAPPVRSVDGWRLDIAAHVSAKRRAIAAHASQYSNLITDDPNGFRLPSDLLSVFHNPYEVFLRTP